MLEAGMCTLCGNEDGSRWAGTPEEDISWFDLRLIALWLAVLIEKGASETRYLLFITYWRSRLGTTLRLSTSFCKHNDDYDHSSPKRRNKPGVGTVKWFSAEYPSLASFFLAKSQHGTNL
jgi:hypothetical protein